MTEGDTVTVRRICFDCVRARCAALGVREGDRVRLAGSGLASVDLEGEGRVIRCPVDYARFVEVAPEAKR